MIETKPSKKRPVLIEPDYDEVHRINLKYQKRQDKVGPDDVGNSPSPVAPCRSGVLNLVFEGKKSCQNSDEYNLSTSSLLPVSYPLFGEWRMTVIKDSPATSTRATASTPSKEGSGFPRRPSPLWSSNKVMTSHSNVLPPGKPLRAPPVLLRKLESAQSRACHVQQHGSTGDEEQQDS